MNEQASPTRLSMVSSNFSYALKPMKIRGMPILNAACEDMELRMLTISKKNTTLKNSGQSFPLQRDFSMPTKEFHDDLTEQAT